MFVNNTEVVNPTSWINEYIPGRETLNCATDVIRNLGRCLPSNATVYRWATAGLLTLSVISVISSFVCAEEANQNLAPPPHRKHVCFAELKACLGENLCSPTQLDSPCYKQFWSCFSTACDIGDFKCTWRPPRN
jgi:hypothetical protein